MSYSTFLYAVDIDKLRAAVGSKDPELLERLREANSPSDEEDPPPPPYDYVADWQLRVTGEGEILFGGKATTIEKLPQLIKSLTGSLELFFETPSNDQHTAVMIVGNECYSQSGLREVIYRLETMAPDVLWSRSSSEDGSDRASFSADDKALDSLIASVPKNWKSRHGYALEVLSFVLGERLPDEDEIGDLELLQLHSPLATIRHPLALKAPDDFPYLSFLTAEEVVAEVQRLAGIELSFPADPDIENARHAYANCMKVAADSQRGVVSFYY
ncbi:DUF7691 family protein [Anatilimnocola floriformis]|uniref:DUF7691 family protein n=1 Tax=Anatilimnocola floriformis TaxID=2948575 RepID=UPI0020C2A49A|nr:hypothetical protein [Anatilimnocola floriformis]